jgi:uncharacterized protein YndB with AHSA1/START domain
VTRHDAFTLTRAFAAPPAAVFALFADEERWRRWFRMPGPSAGAEYTHDFRVGGGTTASSEFRMPDGRVEQLENRAAYLAIEPDRLVSYAYVAIVDGILRWSSLVTVELAADGDGTALTWTEQVALLHPHDPTGEQDLAHLRGGVRLQHNAMALALA